MWEYFSFGRCWWANTCQTPVSLPYNLEGNDMWTLDALYIHCIKWNVLVTFNWPGEDLSFSPQFLPSRQAVSPLRTRNVVSHCPLRWPAQTLVSPWPCSFLPSNQSSNLIAGEFLFVWCQALSWASGVKPSRGTFGWKGASAQLAQSSELSPGLSGRGSADKTLLWSLENQHIWERASHRHVNALYLYGKFWTEKMQCLWFSSKFLCWFCPANVLYYI